MKAAAAFVPAVLIRTDEPRLSFCEVGLYLGDADVAAMCWRDLRLAPRERLDVPRLDRWIWRNVSARCCPPGLKLEVVKQGASQ